MDSILISDIKAIIKYLCAWIPQPVYECHEDFYFTVLDGKGNVKIKPQEIGIGSLVDDYSSITALLADSSMASSVDVERLGNIFLQIGCDLSRLKNLPSDKVDDNFSFPIVLNYLPKITEIIFGQQFLFTEIRIHFDFYWTIAEKDRLDFDKLIEDLSFEIHSIRENLTELELLVEGNKSPNAEHYKYIGEILICISRAMNMSETSFY